MGEWTWRAFKIVQSIVERLPRPWAYALAVVAARIAWWFSPLARPLLEYNLKVACPELTEAELKRLSRLNFRNHAKACVELMMLPHTRVRVRAPLLLVHGTGVLVPAGGTCNG